jgi:hypothetical protein
MPHPPMPAPALHEFLRHRRAACNALFATARRRWPHLAADDFLGFLRTELAPVVEAVTRIAPAQGAAVAEAGYQIGLQLVAEKSIGLAAPASALNALWRNTFPALAAPLAAAPRAVLGSLSNATLQITGTPGAETASWLTQLARLGPRCTEPAQLLALAPLLAWRAGLAHFREAALAGGDRLPPSLALAALGAPESAGWPELRDAHARDPWFGCGPDDRAVPPLAELRRVGAFRGFGGLFSAPPSVGVQGGRFVAGCGGEAWVLHADCYGATFHRASPSTGYTPPAAGTSRAAALARLLPAGHAVSSVALLPHSVAVTSGFSHAIWVGPASLA